MLSGRPCESCGRKDICKQDSNPLVGSEHTDFVTTSFILDVFAGEGVLLFQEDFWNVVERFSRRVGLFGQWMGFQVHTSWALQLGKVLSFPTVIHSPWNLI